MYIVFPVLFFGLKTSHEYFRLFSIYADLPKSVPPLGTQLRDFAGALSSGLVGGVSVVASLVRICSLVLLVAGAVAWAKAPTVPTGPTGLLARVWIAVWIVGFAGGEIAMNTAKSVNGTIYVMLPLAALVALLCSSLRRGAPRAALTRCV